MRERWVTVVGFPKYQVSDYGRIRSFWKYTDGQIMKTKATGVYPKVGLVAKPKTPQKHFNVHTLVLEAFVGPRPAGLQACHNDGNPFNNSLPNLRWDTPPNNNIDKRQHGTAQRGEKHGCAKLTQDDVLVIRARYNTGESPTGLAGEYRIHRSHLHKIVRGKSWGHI